MNQCLTRILRTIFLSLFYSYIFLIYMKWLNDLIILEWKEYLILSILFYEGKSSGGDQTTDASLCYIRSYFYDDWSFYRGCLNFYVLLTLENSSSIYCLPISFVITLLTCYIGFSIYFFIFQGVKEFWVYGYRSFSFDRSIS